MERVYNELCEKTVGANKVRLIEQGFVDALLFEMISSNNDTERNDDIISTLEDAESIEQISKSVVVGRKEVNYVD
ncbi:MAG: hypothetical protein E7220_03720 [Clostridiales bacterium]|nr:hypothetical protein [Clostridiales bacterium]